MSNELKQSIFYIKYYAKKHGMIIERKATLDNECFEGVHKKHGYAYKRYLDLTATEEIDNGKPQYRTASVKWTISTEPTLT
jgi:hypothetical protein